MKLKQVILLFLLYYCNLSQGQNLVPDSSFEFFYKLPNKYIFLQEPIQNYLSDWFVTIPGTTTDYFNSSNPILPWVNIPRISFPPSSLQGNKTDINANISANTAKGFCGIVNILTQTSTDTTYYSEYVSSRLQRPLTKNAKYSISFNYNVLDYQSWIIDRIGAIVYDTINNININSYSKGTSNLFYNKPQTSSSKLLVDTNRWIKSESTFKSNGGEKYITIGYFRQENSIDFFDTSKSFFSQNGELITRKFGNYIFLDDVSIYEIPGIIGQDTACNGDIVTFKTNVLGPYLWTCIKDSANFISHDSIITFVANKSCWLYLKTGQLIDSQYLYVKPKPIFSIGTDTSFCKGDVLRILATGEFDKIKWNNNSNSNAISITNPGKYIATVEKSGCFNSKTIQVREIPLPDKIQINQYSICSADNQYVNIVLNPDFHYNWKNDGDSGNIKTLSIVGWNLVTITNKNNCMIYDSIYLLDICNPTLFIPNAFYPSGVNKSIRPQGTYIKSILWKIYDRYGAEIFHSTSLTDSWDGSDQHGNIYPTDVYLLDVLFYGFDDKENHQSLLISLIR